jgi:ribosomal protein S18 acetylase RimI-like enzyme
MKSSFVGFEILEREYIGQLIELFDADPRDYLRHFDPFPFKTSTFESLLSNAKKDVFISIRIREQGMSRTAGFYMLRGMDEGYKVPMFGVYISSRNKGIGLGSIALKHAETTSILNGYSHLRLKVYRENTRALDWYVRQGFREISSCLRSVLLEKQLI